MREQLLSLRLVSGVIGDSADRRARTASDVQRKPEELESSVHELAEAGEVLRVPDPVLLADHMGGELAVEAIVDACAVGADVHDALLREVLRAVPREAGKVVDELL